MLLKGGIDLLDLPHVAQKDDVDRDQVRDRVADLGERVVLAAEHKVSILVAAGSDGPGRAK